MDQAAHAIRPYRPSDSPRLEEIWVSGWAASGLSAFADLDPHDLDAELSCAVRQGATVLVEEWLGRIRGFIAIDSDNSNITHLFVAPFHFSRGVGSALLNEAKRRLPDGFWLMSFEGNHKAGNFYRSHGLHAEARSEGPGMMQSVQMTWP